MREHALANLGSLVSQAEVLRARGLSLMQGAPDGPVDEADRRAYADLHAAARDACRAEAGSGTMPGVDEPDELGSVARLHRSAGLIEHELLVRLAEARAAARRLRG
jgi:hypothetical protein